MWSPDSATSPRDFDRGGEDVRHYTATQFDKGARAFAFCCAVLYAVLTGGLIVSIVKATLHL
jgi:hypothetical protein